MANPITTIRKSMNAQNEARCVRPGYYFVKGDERRFISPDVNPGALERVANSTLSEKKGWGYWIDYSHGIDVHGNPAWSNIDQTDRFI